MRCLLSPVSLVALVLAGGIFGDLVHGSFTARETAAILMLIAGCGFVVWCDGRGVHPCMRKSADDFWFR